ncbi:acetyl-CoA carboxylase biotin carboxylase subunit [Neolewinella antarctica]|uniref:Propionyl-CoA carboxylase alpha chain n=1 Tax=Neolewinella antarctica TaxID=442734 RepID=A0ABX0XAP8_9BACT|nr:acetyl-CoA carboxylase biotin carboxylase subunit [Neolewinella antarctica]NJC26292.1 propionyl-CoA carboxylase alpha chain [Neolewinella antarctica]
MQKILIANRGEIALRIMRTARKMGIKTVAVYSEVDRAAPHVRFADEAVLLGPAPSSQSYLAMDRVIQAALDTGADGIHPGYGFLSENAEFARKVTEAGITFIGPDPHAIKVMGNKLAAKEAVADYDIPMVPGIDKAVTDVAVAKKFADSAGYPILIKAAAGGGGKGMRVVTAAWEMEEQMERAVSEAVSAFGDGAVFLEKYVTAPRHIEIQVLADNHGNIVYLFERECSIQRRHQKVVEEAPSVPLNLDPDLRVRMGEAAVNVARACDYKGAGTVEFLIDGDNNFYFLEMNTRLQVEHPVTELITGVDLVEQQINVARGIPLAMKQEDLRIKGHAIELRVYAEDPLNNFLPSIGTLETYQIPTGPGVRVDDGFEEGMEIPIYYDPMIAKLVTYGSNRAEALQLMRKAIQDYKIKGIETTLPFGRFVMDHEAFISGNFDTGFIQAYYSPEDILRERAEIERIGALAAAAIFEESRQALRVPERTSSEWSQR